MGKYREVRFDQDAQTRLLRGIDRLTRAVSITLGPRGRNVILAKEFGSPKVVNDGVTIAQEQTYRDPFENMGAQLVKQVSKETEDAAGDGTTTATVLAHAIITDGLKNITAGASPLMLKRGLEAAANAVVDGLVGQSQDLADKREMARVATISANDGAIGETIVDAMEAAGSDGVITVEESDSIDTTYEVVEGLQFDRGYLSPYFVTDAERMEAELKEPYILVTDQKIKKARDLLPVLEKIAQANKPLLVIAPEVEGEALTTLVINKLRGTLNAVAVKAPGFGDRRKAMLQDIAVLTGGLVVAEDAGMKVEAAELEQLGRAERVVVNDDDTTIVGGRGEAKNIQGRIEQIKKQMETSDADYDREKLRERMAKLTGGVAVIKVGAATEAELEEKKHRMEDALEATKAAVEEGILPGGGVALIHAARELEKLTFEDERQIGVRLLRRALEAPLRQLAENAGYEGNVVVEKVKALDPGYGFDAIAEDYVDMKAAGIIDPTKVTKSAVENAASVAGMILTSGAAVAIREDKASGSGMPPMPDDLY